MRKAEEFKAIEDLGLSKRTGNFLLKNLGSIDRIIFEGRKAYFENAYEVEINADGIHKTLSHKTTDELIYAIEESDLIRRDIHPGSFFVGRLYRIVGNLLYVAYFDDFRTLSPEQSYSEANKAYEEFKCPTKEQCSKLKAAVAARLSIDEYVVLMTRIAEWIAGINEHRSSLGSYCNYGADEIRKTFSNATNKLYFGDYPLPPFPIEDEDIIPKFS